MSEPDLPLDEALRERLLTLAEQAEPLDAGPRAAAAREQAIQRTLAKARAPRVLRWQVWSGAALAAAAALLLASLQPWARGAEDVRGPAVVAGASEARDRTPAAGVVTPAVACALANAVAAARFADGATGTRTLAIGTHASALASVDTVVAPGLVAPCTAQLTLDAGRVSVHARDLAGGRLEVRAGDVRVVVTGTVFAVERREAAVRVALAEGRLLIHVGDAPPAALDAGQRAVIEAGQLRREPLPVAEQLALLAEHGVEAPAVLLSQAQAEPGARLEPGAAATPAAAARAAAGADALLSQADVERRAGRVAQARELYRRAATGSGMAAEAAWMRLCQLELEAGQLDAARQALAGYARRFPHGTLGAEAAWTAVRVAQLRGDEAAARRAAEGLVATHPRSPQAAAARRLLGAPTP
jgi:hypothetical protein